MADYYNGELQNESGGGSSGGTTTVTGITEAEALVLIAQEVVDWAERGQEFPSSGFFFAVERTIVSTSDRDTPDEVSIGTASGTNNYVLRIDENPNSSQQLPNEFLDDIRLGTEIEIVQGTTIHWRGRVVSVTDLAGEPNAQSLRINFPTRTGTFTTGLMVTIRFGYVSDPQILRNVEYLNDHDPLPILDSTEAFRRFENTVIVRGRNTYQPFHRHIPATPGTGDWDSFTATDFLGPRGRDPITASANEYYYNYIIHHWRQTEFLQNAYHWINAGDSVIDGDSSSVFIGEFSLQADATDSVSFIGYDPNDTYYAYFSNDIYKLDGDSFVEHVSGSDIYEWIPVSGETTGISLIDHGLFNENYNYERAQVVETLNDGFFISLIDDNLGNTPQDNPDEWEAFGGRNPRSYYVTTGLTTRQPRTLSAIDVVNSEGVLSFDTMVFQIVSGGVLGISFTDIQDESDADLTVDATNAVLELPAGTYDISLEFYGNQQPNTNIFLGFYKIQSGVDDVEEFASTNRQKEYFGTSTTTDIHAVYRVEEHDVVFDQAEKFYLRLGNLASATRIAGYFRIEKVR